MESTRLRLVDELAWPQRVGQGLRRHLGLDLIQDPWPAAGLVPVSPQLDEDAHASSSADYVAIPRLDISLSLRLTAVDERPQSLPGGSRVEHDLDLSHLSGFLLPGLREARQDFFDHHQVFVCGVAVDDILAQAGP